MLKYDRIDILEGIDINKASASREYDICHQSINHTFTVAVMI